MKKMLLLTVLLYILWAILILMLIRHWSYSGQIQEQNESIHLQENAGVFVAYVSEREIFFHELGVGDSILFWKVDDEKVWITQNAVYVDIEKTELKEDQRVLSREERISLLRILSNGSVANMEYSPGVNNPDDTGIKPVYYDYVDVRGTYVGRIVLTTEYPLIPKDYTDVDTVLNKQTQKNRTVLVNSVIKCMGCAILLLVPAVVLLYKKKEGIMIVYAGTVTLLLILILFR